MSETICHPLSGVCATLNLVGHHLETREWVASDINQALLPPSVRIVYRSGVELMEREDALPLVTYKVDAIRLLPFSPQTVNVGAGTTITEASTAITFKVSTTSEALTSALAFDIGALIMANHPDLRSAGLFIQATDISGVQKDQGGYYIASIQLQAALQRLVWKKSSSQGILREVSIQATGD